MTPERIAELSKGIPAWKVEGGKALIRELLMQDFAAATALIAAIQPVADAMDHHPDLHLTGYRRLRIELSTHSIGALSEKDFILAAKIDELTRPH